MSSATCQTLLTSPRTSPHFRTGEDKYSSIFIFATIAMCKISRKIFFGIQQSAKCVTYHNEQSLYSLFINKTRVSTKNRLSINQSAITCLYSQLNLFLASFDLKWVKDCRQQFYYFWNFVSEPHLGPQTLNIVWMKPESFILCVCHFNHYIRWAVVIGS